MKNYPEVSNFEKVGTYPAVVKAGGGYVWDEVLEYRVWFHPHSGAPDICGGSDYYYAFGTYEEALDYSKRNKGSEHPIALILQNEYIDEPEDGKYIHVKEPRLAEWYVEFLSRPRRNENTIPNFMSPDAPSNRLDIIRGLAK